MSLNDQQRLKMWTTVITLLEVNDVTPEEIMVDMGALYCQYAEKHTTEERARAVMTAALDTWGRG